MVLDWVFQYQDEFRIYFGLVTGYLKLVLVIGKWQENYYENVKYVCCKHKQHFVYT